MKSHIPCLLISVFTISNLLITECSAQRLDRFASKARVSYGKTITYFGYLSPGNQPDEISNGKNFYYLYFQLPDSVAELGIRMISPVPAVVMPDKGDLVTENYYSNEKDKTNYFDPWIAIEKAENPKHFLQNDTAAKWITIGFNDDSSELFWQPNGKRNNALLRIINKQQPTDKKIAPGFYRICFTDNKQPEVKGSFVVQLGTAHKLPGLKLLKNPGELLR